MQNFQQNLSLACRDKIKQPVIYCVLVIILSLLPIVIKSTYVIQIFIIVFVYIIATSSLRTIATSGQVSLGHAGFMSIGAYSAGIMSKLLGWAPWITIPLGAIATSAIAILVGYPFSRLRSIYFSMISLFFGVAILSINSVFAEYTGGSYGLTGIPPMFIGSKIPYYYYFLGLTVFSLLFLYRIESCRIGMSFKAIAQSPQVASSIGINESGYRVLALAVGCFIVGLVGASYAHYNTVLSHSSFNFLASIYLLVYMIVGGIQSFGGPIIGVVILVWVPELFRDLKEFTPYIFVAIILVVVYVMPKGITGLFERVKLWIKMRREGKVITHAS